MKRAISLATAVAMSAIGATAMSAAFVLSLGISDGAAQAVSGTVLDNESDEPVASAAVGLIRRDGHRVRTVEADSLGRFEFSIPAEGRYLLRAERIGYETVTSPEFAVGPTDSLVVELRIDVHAVPIAPLTITVRGSPPDIDPRLDRWGFYDRRTQFGTMSSGKAHFLDLEAIRRRNAMRVTDLFRDLAGVRVVPVGGRSVMVQGVRGCRLAFYLDGVRMRGGANTIDNWVMVPSLAAVEVYASFPFPAQYLPTYPECGSVVVWTGFVNGK